MLAHSISLIGQRETNEDQHVVIFNSGKQNKQLRNVNFFSIFDGHGGKEVSRFLKSNLPHYFTDRSNDELKFPVPDRYVNRVFDHLQKTLILNFNKVSQNTGSTCLSMLHFRVDGEDYLQLFNTGDCRAVMCFGNKVIQLTKDHKPNMPEEKKRIEALGGKIVPDGKNCWRIKDLSVSRAFGDLRATPYVTHRPQIHSKKIDVNTKFVIMACDGLWDVLSNKEAVQFVLAMMTKYSLKKRNIAKALANYALAKGSGDNVTVLIVFMNIK